MPGPGFDGHFPRRGGSEPLEGERDVAFEVDSVEGFIRAVEAARQASGLSKAALARRMGMMPEAIRRLFTHASPNPTLATILNLLTSMGYSLTLSPSRRRGPLRKRRRGGTVDV